MSLAEDAHFQYHRRGSGSGSSNSESDYPLPVKLVDNSCSVEDVEKQQYKADSGSAIGPGISQSMSRASNASGRSLASGYSVEEIYGDAAPENIRVTRQLTMETIKSRISTVYSENYFPADGGDTVNRDGSEFKDIDPELVTWEGPDDPENPRNWSPFRKWVTTVVVSVYTMIAPLSSSILTPAVPAIAEQLHIESSTMQNLTVSIFVLAFAICPLFIGGLSELFGRQVVLNVSIVLLLIFNIACALARNTGQLLIFRFLAGMAGAAPISVGAGTLADMFNDKDRNTPLALYSLGPNLGPVIAPIIAGFLVEYTSSWRWVLWTLSIINGVVAFVGLITYKETYAPTLLSRKAKKLRKESGNDNLHTVFEIARTPFMERFLTGITRPIVMLFTNPIIMGLGLYMAFVYGFMYLMLVTYPDLWYNVYHFKPGIAGLMYLGLGVGSIFSVASWTPLTQYTYLRLTARNGGIPKPEFRIFLVSPTAVILGCGLLWYGWSAEAKLVWIMPVVGTGIFGFALFPVFQCIQNYLIDMNPRYSASAVGAAAVFRSTFGFGFPLFGTAMYNRLGYGWANTICGILMFILGIPFPIIIYFYGERVRQWNDDRLERKHNKT
ncbi:Tpo3p [Sugiyamaella lignohabitans]|uniref:Tpo3p n=1 Tax=Sugiyamaella lignohabitans TaxID=796027 RepID=A0A167D3I8_9ASCO|nr:Tpo3p [Sugiyamaella lignohabitans]ANB12434.1 Tpo3p [Sugiyamaella lignohabitans]